MKVAMAEVRTEQSFVVEQTHMAIREGDRNSWLVADNYLKLSTLGWTQQQIADEFKCSQGSVSRFIRTAQKYVVPHNRPRFWDAQIEVDPSQGPRTLGTGQDEWYTPPEYLSLVRAVMGGIDLDPASCLVAQANVLADRFYSEEDDGLSQPWDGRIFLNPPYSQPKVSQFIEKLIREHDAKNAKEAITLTTNNTDTDWFQSLARAASAVCFTDGRVSFIAPDGRKPSPNQGHVFAYLGDSPSKFDTIFASVGVIFRKF